jgi:hypothetical protein
MMRATTNDRPSLPASVEKGRVRFNYEGVEPPVAKFLKSQADRIRRQCATSTIQIGKALLEAKRYLSHGAFLNWVECEAGIPVRTAQAYMRAANWAAGKSASVAHLTPSALYLLSATGVPDDFVVGILNRVEAGEYLAPSTIRQELRAFRLGECGDPSGREACAQTEPQADAGIDASSIDGGARDAITELVSILIERLTATDFARVRDIFVRESVLSDPQLAQNLHAAFCQCDGRPVVVVSDKAA